MTTAPAPTSAPSPMVTPRLSLLPGCYSISAGILDPQGLRPLDLHARAYPFTVVSTRRDFGFVYLEHEWRHTAADPAASAPDAADEECAV